MIVIVLQFVLFLEIRLQHIGLLRVAEAASSSGTTINDFINRAIRNALARNLYLWNNAGLTKCCAVIYKGGKM